MSMMLDTGDALLAVAATQRILARPPLEHTAALVDVIETLLPPPSDEHLELATTEGGQPVRLQQYDRYYGTKGHYLVARGAYGQVLEAVRREVAAAYAAQRPAAVDDLLACVARGLPAGVRYIHSWPQALRVFLAMEVTPTLPLSRDLLNGLALYCRAQPTLAVGLLSNAHVPIAVRRKIVLGMVRNGVGDCDGLLELLGAIGPEVLDDATVRRELWKRLTALMAAAEPFLKKGGLPVLNALLTVSPTEELRPLVLSALDRLNQPYRHDDAGPLLLNTLGLKGQLADYLPAGVTLEAVTSRLAAAVATIAKGPTSPSVARSPELTSQYAEAVRVQQMRTTRLATLVPTAAPPRRVR